MYVHVLRESICAHIHLCRYFNAFRTKKPSYMKSSFPKPDNCHCNKKWVCNSNAKSIDSVLEK